jgi:hypothetical protein
LTYGVVPVYLQKSKQSIGDFAVATASGNRTSPSVKRDRILLSIVLVLFFAVLYLYLELRTRDQPLAPPPTPVRPAPIAVSKPEPMFLAGEMSDFVQTFLEVKLATSSLQMGP